MVSSEPESTTENSIKVFKLKSRQTINLIFRDRFEYFLLHSECPVISVMHGTLQQCAVFIEAQNPLPMYQYLYCQIRLLFCFTIPCLISKKCRSVSQYIVSFKITGSLENRCTSSIRIFPSSDFRGLPVRFLRQSRTRVPVFSYRSLTYLLSPRDRAGNLYFCCWLYSNIVFQNILVL